MQHGLTQRRASVRIESGSRPKSSDNSAVRKSQADGPWQNAARLGSPHSELARLTVSELPSRYVVRVNRHTLKKAVMAAYDGAGFGRAIVTDGQRSPGKAFGTPAKGRLETT